jgi:Tfp pilus assembly protein PilW
MDFKLTNRNSSAAFTLPELVVSMGLGGLLLLCLGSFYCFSHTSFTSMANYTELNNQSRNASDTISRDIRSAISVISASTNQASGTTNYIVLSDPLSFDVITYSYDPGAKTLTRVQGNSERTLLNGVDLCAFSLYQRPTNSSTAYEQFPVSNPANAKLVSFKWSCTRKLAVSGVDSEAIQMAVVNLRNQ